MREIVVVIDAEMQHSARVSEAVDLINGSQRYFHLTLEHEPLLVAKEQGVMQAEAVASEISKTFPAQRALCIADARFSDNWFSHEYRNCAVITTCDWEEIFAPPSLRAYLAYQMAQALLPMEADVTEQMLLHLVHEPPIGCVNDLCAVKSHIRFGMIAGNICYACDGSLRQFGIDPTALDAIRQVLARVRSEATGRPKLIDPFSAFVVVRFSENDENSNALRYGVLPGLGDIGLRGMAGNDVVRSAQILDQVFQLIDRSRFVVAKVDVENLNVYFELGLAMGLGKDVLLISESSLVVSLPSDLSNWECLTYDKGNYEQLRNRVGHFYRDNYHLYGVT